MSEPQKHTSQVESRETKPCETKGPAASSRAVVLVVGVVMAVLALSCWLLPDDAYSESERRYLREMPALTVQSVASGRFMDQFEAYAQDSFPFREPFRRIEALANVAFGRLDGNGVYLAKADGKAVLPFEVGAEDVYACTLDYQLDAEAVARTLARYQAVYDSYLASADARVFAAVIPDKSYYLAYGSGHPVLDYEALFSQVEEGMPFATHIDLTDALEAESYYRTDTHWRQEKLAPVVDALLAAMGGQGEGADDQAFDELILDRPFSGVYVGQSALPLAPDDLVWLESDATRAARAFDHEHAREIPVYDADFAFANELDPYELFLGGPLSLVTVESPLAATDRELVIFRDSFGSALAPLLLDSYAKVTLVDLRYIQPEALADLVSFEGADVLFLQSTLSLNS